MRIGIQRNVPYLLCRRTTRKLSTENQKKKRGTMEQSLGKTISCTKTIQNKIAAYTTQNKKQKQQTKVLTRRQRQ